jgi:hypothetical protein
MGSGKAEESDSPRGRVEDAEQKEWNTGFQGRETPRVISGLNLCTQMLGDPKFTPLACGQDLQLTSNPQER